MSCGMHCGISGDKALSISRRIAIAGMAVLALAFGLADAHAQPAAGRSSTAHLTPPTVPVPAPDPALAGVPLDPAWPKTLLVVADSVVLGIKPALMKGLPDWQTSYAGRPSLMLVNAVEQLRRQKGEVASVVVVGLGYNTLWSKYNTHVWAERFDTAADELLKILKERGARKIVWVLLRELSTDMVAKGVISAKMYQNYWHYADVNQRLRALKARHPEMALADWITPGRQAGLTVDAVHLNMRGAELMVEVLKPAIGISPAAPPLPVPSVPLASAPPPAAPVRKPEPQAEAPVPPRDVVVSSVEPPSAVHAEPGVPKAGEVLRDCPQCPEMVVVPAGRFLMGSPDADADGRSEERPQREVVIAKPLAIAKFEVTFAEWEACVQGDGCRGNPSPDDEGWGKGRRPVVNVSWDDAREYIEWLSKKSGKAYRLLTEAEWEYAARAGSTAPYATGEIITTLQANFNDSEGGDAAQGAEKYRERTVDVGTFAPNAWGLHDMHGNVWEWVEDTWHDTYADASSDGAARLDGDEATRVLRGGSWYRVAASARSASRHSDVTSTRSNEVGFRVARAL